MPSTASASPSTGQTLGIVGESGCGKSVTALSIMGLMPKPPAEIVSGEILFDGRDLTRSRKEARGRARREIAMIFQDPMTSLNPMLKIGRRSPRRSTATTAMTRTRRAAGGRAARGGAGSRVRPSAARRLPAPLLGRHAPAGDDRDRARLQPEAADRRRADHGARRDRAGARCSTCSRTCASEHEHGADPHHARPGRRRRGRRRGRGHVRRARSSSRRSGQDSSTDPSTPTPRRCSAPSRAEARTCAQAALAAIPGRPPRPDDPPEACRFAPRCRYAGTQDTCTDRSSRSCASCGTGHWVRHAAPAQRARASARGGAVVAERQPLEVADLRKEFHVQRLRSSASATRSTRSTASAFDSAGQDARPRR